MKYDPNTGVFRGILVQDDALTIKLVAKQQASFLNVLQRRGPLPEEYFKKDMTIDLPLPVFDINGAREGRK